MSSTPIETLKKGLSVFQENINARKRKLQELLQDQKSITSAEQQWLDEEGNDVEETKLSRVRD